MSTLHTPTGYAPPFSRKVGVFPHVKCQLKPSPNHRDISTINMTTIPLIYNAHCSLSASLFLVLCLFCNRGTPAADLNHEEPGTSQLNPVASINRVPFMFVRITHLDDVAARPLYLCEYGLATIYYIDYESMLFKLQCKAQLSEFEVFVKRKRTHDVGIRHSGRRPPRQAPTLSKS